MRTGSFSPLSLAGVAQPKTVMTSGCTITLSNPIDRRVAHPRHLAGRETRFP
jgi:hypothetical protein